jgi:F-type H+-transporting ATPase subunit delta
LNSNSLAPLPPRRRGRLNDVEKTGVLVAGKDSIISGMAGRYANALFELALEEKALDAVKSDLDKFDALIAANPDLNRLVRSPVYGADEQLKALSAILDKAGIGGLAANFLRVITTNRRLFAVRGMIRGFRALIAKHRGEVTAEVTVAETLNGSNLEALKGALKSVTGGKDIDLDIKIDPAIIGGLIVKVGSRMVDSSLRTKLNAIKFAMKEAR